MAHVVDITTAPTRTLAVTTFHVERSELGAMGDLMGAAFGTVAAHLEAAGCAVTGPAVACYLPTDQGFEVSAGFEACSGFECDAHVEVLVVPAGVVAHTTHLGPYESLPEAYEDLRRGAEAQGQRLLDGVPMCEEYWSRPDAPSTEIRTEVFWPVAAAAEADPATEPEPVT